MARQYFAFLLSGVMFGLSMVPTMVAAGQLRFFCKKKQGSSERGFHIDQGMFLSGENDLR